MAGRWGSLPSKFLRSASSRPTARLALILALLVVVPVGLVNEAARADNTSVGQIPEQVMEPAVAGDGTVLYAFGGTVGSNYWSGTRTNSVYKFDTSTNIGQELVATLPTARKPAGAVYAAGNFYVVGERDGGSAATWGQFHRFNPTTGAFTLVANATNMEGPFWSVFTDGSLVYALSYEAEGAYVYNPANNTLYTMGTGFGIYGSNFATSVWYNNTAYMAAEGTPWLFRFNPAT